MKNKRMFAVSDLSVSGCYEQTKNEKKRTNRFSFKSLLNVGLVVTTLFLSSFTFAGDDSAWTLAQEQGNVKVYYQVVNCRAGKSVILKVENAGENTAEVILDVTVNVDGKVFHQPGRMISIEGNSSAEGVCEKPTNQLLVNLPFPGQEISVNVNLN